MRLQIRFTIVLILSCAGLAAAAEKERDWKLGRVQDSTSSKTTLQVGATSTTNTTGTATATTNGTATTTGAGTSLNATTTSNSQSQGTTSTVIHHITIRDTELLILGADYAYVIEDPYTVSGPLLRRAITNRKHGCRFIIGEDIKYVQEKGKLIVLARSR
jgi:hypothetical protein